jgi:hypothetical protein
MRSTVCSWLLFFLRAWGPSVVTVTAQALALCIRDWCGVSEDARRR